MTLKNLFESELFALYLREKKNLSEQSIKLYVITVQSFIKEEGYNFEDLERYNNYIINHAIKKRSTHVYSILRAFIEYKITDGNTRVKLLDGLIKPEPPSTIKRERKYLEERDLLAIINNMNEMKHRVIALIQFLTGARSGEVMKIKRGNIIPELYEGKNVLRIIIEGKGNKRNVVFIHEETTQKIIIDFIARNIFHQDFYFLQKRHRSKNADLENVRLILANKKAYERDLKQSMHKLGIDKNHFATHDYRRCFARRVWTKYKDIVILKDLLNHVNPSTTIRYLKQSGLQTIDHHKAMQTD